MIRGIIFSLLLAFIFASCVKDKPQPVDKGLPNYNHRGVLTLDEGVFGNSNADLSFIDLNLKKSYRNLFLNKNVENLGDIAQHIIQVDSTYWITLNNSNKIVVVAVGDLSLQQSISGIQFPRRMERINDSIIAVTSLYTPNIYFIHSKTFQLIKTLQLPYQNSEGLISYNQRLYVCCWNENCSQLYTIETASLSLVDSITLPCKAAHDIVRDHNDHFWVLCGNTYKGVSSHLLRVVPEEKMVITNFAFNAGEEVVSLTPSVEKDRLFFIKIDYNGGVANNGIYVMDVQDKVLPQTALIQANKGSYFYSLGIDSATTHLFTSDPRGFNQHSTTYEYTQSGILLESYQSGLGTNQFIFR